MMQPGPLIVDVEGTTLSAADKDILSHPAVGGVILFQRNYDDPAQLQYLVAAMREVRPNLMITADQEGGRVQRFREGFTELPASRHYGELYDSDPDQARELLRYYTRTMVTELQAAGVTVCLSPVLDLDYQLSEVIGRRSYHSCPNVVAELAGIVTETMQELGMPVVAKHFPGHGAVKADSHVELPVDDRALHSFHQTDLKPFVHLLNRLDAVMPGHLLVPKVDPKYPASLSKQWVTSILRQELGYQGLVISDDLSMGAMKQFGHYLDRVSLALEAGCDMLLTCNNRESVEASLQALEGYKNPTSQARIQQLINKTM